MFFLSTGFRCGTFSSNEAGFTKGTMINAPDSAWGSAACASFCSAMIDAYSVPCAPAISASVGPGFAPFTMMTGIPIAASTPAGTWMYPVAFWPGAAVAVPTVTVADWPISQNKKNSGRRTRGIGSSFWFGS